MVRVRSVAVDRTAKMNKAAPAQPSYSEELELLRVRRSAGVVPESVTLSESDGHKVLRFDLETEQVAGERKADIRDIEAVEFHYHDGYEFGRTAPRNVIVPRPDFPRNIGHLCSGPPGCPAAPCLAIGGIQPVYERGGIEALMERLRGFMRDAKTGSLMAEGWEAVPFGVHQTYAYGQVTPSFYQDYAMEHPDKRSALGVAVVNELDEVIHVALVPQFFEPDDMRRAIGCRTEGDKRLGVPTIFLWPDAKKVEHDPVYEDWPTIREFRIGLGRIGVDTAFDAAVGALFQAECDFKFCHSKGRKGLVVVLGVWRPSPLLPNYFGYSEHIEARKLELRAYFVSQKLAGQVIDDDATVDAIIANHPPTPDLFRWVSGLGELPPITLFGAGALGSAIFNNLVRAGANDVIVQDSDTIMPHNLARHTALTSDIYKPKVTHSAALASGMVIEGVETTIVPHKGDILALSNDEFVARTRDRLIVDATADERVRTRIDELRSIHPTTTVRSEIFNDGRLGATFVSLPGGPGLAELMLSMIALAVDEPAVACWLDHEARHPFGLDPFMYGFGCGSQTVHLPNYVVEQHASATLPTIIGDRSESGIGLNPLDEHYRPLGWRWHPIMPFTSFTPLTEVEWRVIVSASALKRMTSLRTDALPSETGGYLYGSWDAARQTITILSASALPPGSTFTSTTLELGPAGQLQEERRFLRKTRERLFLCGTWHSHPGESAAMSGKDYKAMERHHAVDVENKRPTLIVIVADDDVQAHLKI